MLGGAGTVGGNYVYSAKPDGLTALVAGGSVLVADLMKMKAARDTMVASFWAGMGLPTRRDQERALHALNQMQSRLIDLEDKLVEIEAQRRKA